MSAPKKRYCVFRCDALVAQSVPLHRFPHPEKHPNLFAAWVTAVGDRLKETDPMRIFKNKRICDHHFEATHKTSGRRLILNAVPTLNFDCVRQSSAAIVETDHNYCLQRREPQKRTKTPKKRLVCSACPTLFTKNEMESGTASKTYPKVDAGHVSSDHSYNKRKLEDHNYCSAQPSSAETFKPPDKSTNDDAKNGIDPSSIDEFEGPSTENIFSWQKQEILYPTEDTDVLMCPGEERSEELQQELGEVSLYDDPGAKLDTHAEFQCNVCENKIKGFRYTCVQCADWDLCGACEARELHAAHYVLRVPSPRPYNEIQAVLAAIRQQLLSENLFLSEQITEDCLKSEPEEEGAPAEPDPLRALSADGGGRSLEEEEDEHTDGSGYSPPRRKRRRRRSSGSSDSSQPASLPDTHSSSDPPSPVPTHDEPCSETPKKQNDASRRKRKPLPCSAPKPDNHLDMFTEPSHSITYQSGNQPVNVLELPAGVYQVSNDMFRVPGTVLELPGTIFEVPDAMGVTDSVLEVPDDATVFIQEPPNTSDSLVHSIYMGEDAVGCSEDSWGLLHLRVPPDTDNAALTQALTCQAYVVMQPLAITEVIDDR